MRCPIQSRDNAEILLAYCDRKLDVESMLLLERHVAECAACREVLDGQRAIWAALDQWEAAEISPDFNRRMWQRIEASESAGFWRRLFQPPLQWALKPSMPVAAAAVVLVAGLLLRAPGNLPPAPRVVSDAVDIEQVERTLEDLEMLRELAAPARGDEVRPL